MTKSNARRLAKNEKLLRDCRSNQSWVWFYVNSVIVLALPFWFFWKIQLVEIDVVSILASALSAYLLTLACANKRSQLIYKTTGKGKNAAMTDFIKNLMQDPKLSRKERNEKIQLKKRRSAEFEAATFAIFYNNALFFSIVTFSSFCAFPSLIPALNYAIPVIVAATLLALFSKNC